MVSGTSTEKSVSKIWGVDRSVRARKVTETARPKAVIAAHHIDTSLIVTNAQGKTKRI